MNATNLKQNKKKKTLNLKTKPHVDTNLFKLKKKINKKKANFAF